MSTYEAYFGRRTRVAASGCRIWTGCRSRLGYGELREHRKAKLAHRKAWELAFGPIPSGMCVCHRCDNPPCVEPTHLFLGSNAENTADRHAKGRDARGLGNGAYTRPDQIRRHELNGRAKLTNAQVIELRRRYAAGSVTQKSLAEEFGVCQATVSYALNEQCWKGLAD